MPGLGSGVTISHGNVSKCEMSMASLPSLPPLPAPLLSIRRYQLPLLVALRALLLRILPISGETRPDQARPGWAPGRVRSAQPGAGAESADWPGRQCVMVMLTCPTFVIHLCDNWDRCFHVHPQCVSNQDQRLVNTVRDKRRATSPDRTTSSVDHHSSPHCNCSLSLVWCDNNHQVGIFTTSSHQ